MISALDKYYLQQAEPIKGTLLALRDLVLKMDKDITNTLKYGMPFFSYKGKMFCYLWIHKKYKQPYIGIVEGKSFNETYLIQENRSRMKIFLIDPEKDLPIEIIDHILHKALALYKKTK